MTRADVLVLHLNAVQEAVQPGGDTDFGGLLDRIAEVVAGLDVPVVVKEVGFGLAPEDVDRSWRPGWPASTWQVRAAPTGRRGGPPRQPRGAVAAAFAGWGWSTVESLHAAVDRVPEGTTVIASGGLADGVDAVKCLALGADLAGFGRRLLPAAAEGARSATEALGVLVDQVRIATWAVAADGVASLSPQHLRPA
jgi:isopentenyl-diphosphate Delta-isomerase